MPDGRPRVALVSPPAPLVASPLRARLIQLVGLGWDAHFVSRASVEQEERDRDGPALRRRVHKRPRSRGRVRALVRRPRATLATRLGSRKRQDRALGEPLATTLLALGPALIHFHSCASALAGLPVASSLGCRVVVTPQGEELASSEPGEPQRWSELWGRADAVHLSDDALWERALARGCPEGLTRSVDPPAPDVDFFDPDRLARPRPTNGRVRILSAGQLAWSQGYEYALQAVGLLRDSGVECDYRVVGDGAYIDALGFARHQLGLAGSVEFVTPAGRYQLREEMSRADVFLCPALIEGTSPAVAEAQAMGLPVVAADKSGLPTRLADDGATGFVVPRRDPEALAEKLALLAADAELREGMGHTARRRALERASCEPSEAARLGDLYGAVLATDSSRAA